MRGRQGVRALRSSANCSLRLLLFGRTVRAVGGNSNQWLRRCSCGHWGRCWQDWLDFDQFRNVSILETKATGAGYGPRYGSANIPCSSHGTRVPRARMCVLQHERFSNGYESIVAYRQKSFHPIDTWPVHPISIDSQPSIYFSTAMTPAPTASSSAARLSTASNNTYIVFSSPNKSSRRRTAELYLPKRLQQSALG